MFRLCAVLTLALIFLQMSCKRGPTEPEFKSPREYVWDATMLAYSNSPSTAMYSMWGSGRTDVYVSGFSMLGGLQGAMYHYDGKQWTSVLIPSPDYNYLWQMTGFGAHDVWVAGAQLFPDPKLDSAVALHYDGARWKSMLPSHMGSRGLKSVWGTSSQNMFFGSKDGRLIHYDGVEWSVDTLYLGLSITAIGGDEAQVFAVGNTWKGTLDDSVMCFIRNGTQWSLLNMQYLPQHSSYPRFGSYCIYTPAPGVYYSSGAFGIFRWEADKWVEVYSTRATIIRIGGTGPDNILAVGWQEGPVIFHWDGTAWEQIALPDGLAPSDVALYGVWTNGREAFIVGNNYGVSYVLHGK
jgi:hypothetical protein